MQKTPTSYDEIRNLPTNEKIQIAQRLSKRANTRLTALEKSGYDSNGWAYGMAGSYLEGQGRERFYEGKKYNSNHELNRQLMELTGFINAKTSTIKGINSLLKERFDTFAKNHDFGEHLGITAPDPKDFKTKKEFNKAYMDYMKEYNKRYDDFYDFVKTKQLDLMKKQGGDSGTFMDDFVLALQQGYSVKEIMEQYAEYTNSEVTFDVVQERFNRAPYQIEMSGHMNTKQENEHATSRKKSGRKTKKHGANRRKNHRRGKK